MLREEWKDLALVVTMVHAREVRTVCLTVLESAEPNTATTDRATFVSTSATSYDLSYPNDAVNSSPYVVRYVRSTNQYDTMFY